MLNIVPEPLRQLNLMLEGSRVTKANLSSWLCVLMSALSLYVTDKDALTPVRRALLLVGGVSCEPLQRRLTGGFENLLKSAIESGEIGAESITPPDMLGLQQAAEKIEKLPRHNNDVVAARIVLDLFCDISQSSKSLVQSWLSHRMITGIYVNKLTSDA